MTVARIKIRLAKWLDEIAGRGLILLFLRLRLLRERELPPRPVRKILFIKFWGIGSVVLSEPALRWLHKRYPGAEIHYLTFARNAQLFELIPWVQKVHTVPFSNPILFLLKTMPLVAYLRQQKYDLVFDGEFFANYSALLARGLGASRVIGFVRNDGIKRHLLDETIPFRDGLHTAEQFLNLVRRKTTCGRGAVRPRLWLKANGRPGATSAKNGTPYIVMNINASPLAVERRWPRQRFVHLARALLQAYPFDLILIGSAAERRYVAIAERSIARHERVRNLAGRLDLVELAHLLRDAALLISNDSGPIHIAAAFGVPVVGIYGPESPVRYGPLTPKRLVFYENLWCSPCMTVDNAKTVNCINHLTCTTGIPTERVIRQVQSFIGSAVGAGIQINREPVDA